MSCDAYGHLCTNNGSLWTPHGLSFDGIDDFVNLGQPAALNFSGPFALSIWVKPLLGADMSVVSRDGDSGDRGWYLSILADGKVRTMLSSNGSVFTYIDSPVALNDDVWAYLATVYDGQSLKLFVNGRLAKSAAIPPGVYNSSQNVNLGRKPTGDFYFRGLLGLARFHVRILSNLEMQKLYLNSNHSYWIKA